MKIYNWRPDLTIYFLFDDSAWFRKFREGFQDDVICVGRLHLFLFLKSIKIP